MKPSIDLLRRSSLFLALTTGACMGALELPPNDLPGCPGASTWTLRIPWRGGLRGFWLSTTGAGRTKIGPSSGTRWPSKPRPVDASKLVSLGASAKSRNDYWGFKPNSLPLNARVWYPDGPGPYPLVLVAHGNAGHQGLFRPGYEYLGRHLASRGFILASLDMNFINGGIRGENDARGWLFLKHLEVWRTFNEDPENPFHGKVDMEKIGIMGHSRGGRRLATQWP